MEKQNKGQTSRPRKEAQDEHSLADSEIGTADRGWRYLPYGYQWPSSRLSRHQMEKLTVIANHFGKPINQVLKEAVDDYTIRILAENKLT